MVLGYLGSQLKTVILFTSFFTLDKFQINQKFYILTWKINSKVLEDCVGKFLKNNLSNYFKNY